MDSAATPHAAAALELLQNAPSTSRPPRTLGSPHHDQRYLLFFDGGSRGNPGAGGAGAIVVRLCNNDTAAQVIYSAAISYPARTTTNNQAEYEGLLAGLTAAHQHHWTPLAVVGDSMLIIRQMQTYRAPLNMILRTKYARARRIADLLGVNTWMHHPRAANRMADAAANLAMDTAQTSHVLHPTTRADHSAIADLLDGDLSYWRREFAP